MSNVLIGVIGVILFIGLSISGATYLGPRLMDSRVDARAAKYLNETSQIGKAVSDYMQDKGKPPIEAGRDPVEILVTEKYMTRAPEGGSAGWAMNSSANALVTSVDGSADTANKVCIAARTKARMPTPSNIYKCDGSNAPGGVLALTDPCCLL